MTPESKWAVWLADPVKVLATLNRLAALVCLIVALALGGFPGFIFAVIGTHHWIAIKRAEGQL